MEFVTTPSKVGGFPEEMQLVQYFLTNLPIKLEGSWGHSLLVTRWGAMPAGASSPGCGVERQMPGLGPSGTWVLISALPLATGWATWNN